MAKRQSKRSLPRRMTGTDALFWYAESALPIFRPIIAGLYVFEGPISQGDVDLAIAGAVEAVPRLRQRVLEMPLHIGLPEWVDDEHFDLAYHVRHLSLPEGDRKRELLDLTAALFATPLDRERPLWEVYGIEGLDGGRTAVFWKMHHALVDGVGSIAILDGFTRLSPDAAPEPVEMGPPRRAMDHHPSAVARLLRLASHNASESLKLMARAATMPLQAVLHPIDTAETATRTIRGLTGMVSDLAAPAVADPISVGTSGLSRRFDIVDVPIERLKAIKNPLGVTINDVVLTALAATLGRYHRRRRADLETLNCMVPMNLRGTSESEDLGNRVGTFTIVLPVAIEDAADRLDVIVRQTAAAKTDKRGASYPWLAETVFMVPGFVFRWVAKQALGKINVACTNIPGPRDARYLAGVRMEALYPFASVVEGTPLVVALFSYAGRFHLGIDTDPEAIPDPHEITELFEESLAELEVLSGRGPLGDLRTDKPRPASERSGWPNERMRDDRRAQ
jgi:WS/DGAT/MGAT family acyltransferase